MSDIKQNDGAVHKILLYDRKALRVSGIVDVISFDDTEVSLKTLCGELIIEGEELHISVLETSRGEVEVDGYIQSLNYYDTSVGEKKSKFRRFGK